MSCITEIFERIDIQQVNSFLLYGVESTNIEKRSYEERISSTKKELFDELERKITDMKELEHIANYIFSYGTILQDTYMEIGLQAGLILSGQILKNISDYKD